MENSLLWCWDYLRTGGTVHSEASRKRTSDEGIQILCCIDPVTFASKVNDHTLRDLRDMVNEREQEGHKEVLDSLVEVCEMVFKKQIQDRQKRICTQVLGATLRKVCG